MCNPRRIRVTATQQIEEGWERIVRRTVEMRGSVSGEARVRQALDDSIGGPALVMLEAILASGHPDWAETQEGYRCSVPGGYVVYRPSDRSLEMVATLESEVMVSGEAEQRLQGVASGEVTAEGEATYYDDNWGGRTEEHAREEAAAAAQRRLDQARQARLEEDQRQAEAAAAESIESDAQRQAQVALEQAAAQRRAELDHQAAAHLEAVGLQCRQRFHRLLGEAYRDAILAYAQANRAEGIECRDDGTTVEIEFLVRR